MSSSSLPIFPNYVQLREQSRVPLSLWKWARRGTVTAAFIIAAVLFIYPQTGLLLFWGLIIPVLPLVFLLAPGLWRNICPLAAFNQTPRVLNFTRALTPPAWWKEYGYVIGFVAFFILASSRKWLFNGSGPATALLLLGALGLAFVGGWLFKGKSGWCSSICPLYPVQRLYNQTPFTTIPNSHCTPCVGCTKNCYDFNPGVAYLADLYDDDPYYRNYRKFFAAVMPGFILAFFTIPNPPQISIFALYGQFTLYMLVSFGIFSVLNGFIKVSDNKLTALSGAAALNLFYWFGIPAWFNTVGRLGGFTVPAPVIWVGQAAILATTIVWVYRTYVKEPLFLRQLLPESETRIASGAARVLKAAAAQDKLEITFMPKEVRLLTDAGRTLLEIAENGRVPLEAGCRMGMCGADPVIILAGMENISAMSGDEKATLERLGLGDSARLACMCRVNGAVTLTTDIREAQSLAAAQPVSGYDTSIEKVVIIGNGIAGVTAADYLRRNHPDCEIHLIAREKHHLYNRMGINRLIYGRSAMSGLYLQPDAWYDERNITCWLNTQATSIDKDNQEVRLATGQKLPYDRLILACGSSSFVPPLPGFGMAGTFVLREADEAMEIRAFVQKHGCHQAVVSGGGLLGLEAAYALHKLGMRVTVLERGPWLLRRQLDQKGSELLQSYLAGLGLHILHQAEAAAIEGQSRIQQVVLTDGRELPCDLLLVAVGIRPNVELARAAELEIGRSGVRVNDQMQTNVATIYAAGDVCEFNDKVMGLWTVGVEQARVAALNAIGKKEQYHELIPVTALKVVGIDVTSIGRFEPQSEDELVIMQEDAAEHAYRKLVIADNKIVGAILLGYPQDKAAVTAAIKQEKDVAPLLDELQAGNWTVLA